MVEPEAKRIVKVLMVVDTREYEEIGDRFVPIPGSGTENNCSRCGRFHEVHWVVELEGGSKAVVGGTCAKATGLGDVARRAMEDNAKALARLRAGIVRLEARLVERRRAESKVLNMALPVVQFGEHSCLNGKRIPTASMGDATVWLNGVGYTDERRWCLVDAWRGNRLRELTKESTPIFLFEEQIEAVKGRIRRIEERLGKRLEAAARGDQS